MVKSIFSRRRSLSNRLNAQKSTGPKTPDGKAVVALNRLTHGLRAEHLILPGESAEEFENFRARLLQAVPPRDDLEVILAEQVVEAAWKLRRFGRVEQAWFSRVEQAWFSRLVKLDIAGKLDEKLEIATPAAPPNLAMNLLFAEQNSAALKPLRRYETTLRRQFHQALERYFKVRLAATPAAADGSPHADPAGASPESAATDPPAG
jgi:hypothetical protein